MLFFAAFCIQLHCTPTACCPPEATPHKNQLAHYKVAKENHCKVILFTPSSPLLLPHDLPYIVSVCCCVDCTSPSLVQGITGKRKALMKTVELREKRKRRREEIEVVLLISVCPCFVLLVFVCVCVRVQGLDNIPVIASLSPSLHKHSET